MWGSEICWRCTVGLAAEFIQASWSSIFPEKHRPCNSGVQKEDEKPGGAQSTTTQEVEHGQRILGHAPTLWSTVVVAYPKITAGPALVRRKLGSNHWDLIHEGIQGQKRADTLCGSGYSLCPQSLNGGCCPTDRVCGSSSCLPSSAAPASACGQLGYIACGIAEGGGCCPTGYFCGLNNCSPSPGVSFSETCGLSSTLCPSSLGYGCCLSGHACWYSSCYATTTTTFTLTETTTSTDANSNLHTLTTTITSATVLGMPTSTPSSNGVIGQATASATSIPKSAASGTSSSGLTTPELGGIIGAAVFILIVLLIAAFLIIRRLNKAIKISELANSRTSSSGPRSGRSNQRPPLNQEIDALSVDPLMMTPSETSGSIRRPSQMSGANSAVQELETNSPPIFNSPFSPRTPPYTHYPKGYNPVSSSDSSYSQSSGGYRHPSAEISPPLHHNPNAGYFDLSPQSNYPAGHRGSAGSTPSAMTRRPSQHVRQWSNASDQSQVSQNSSNPAELDAGRDGPRERQSSFTRTLQGLGVGMVRMVSRRRSDPIALTGGPTRPERMTSPSGQGLSHIPEAGESRIHLESREGISNKQMREVSLMDPQSPIVKEGTQVFSQEVTALTGNVPDISRIRHPGR